MDTQAETAYVAQVQRHGRRKSRRGVGSEASKQQAVNELKEQLEHDHQMVSEESSGDSGGTLGYYYRKRFLLHREAVQTASSRRAWDRPYWYLLHYLGAETLETCGDADVVESFVKSMKETGSIQFNPTTGEAVKVTGKPLSNATINRSLRALNAILSLAYEEGVIEVPPNIAKLPEAGKTVTVPTVGEVKALLEAAKGLKPRVPYLQEVIFLVIDTGLRRGELFGLKWRDIDLGLGEIHVRQTGRPRLGSGKSYQEFHDRHRVIPMTARVKSILTHLYGQVPYDDNDRVIPNQNGAPYVLVDGTSNKGTRGFDKAVKDAGLAGRVTFGALRDLFAYRMLQNGVPLALAGDLMGYESTRKARARYGHWEQGGAVAAFSRQWFDLGDGDQDDVPVPMHQKEP